MSDATYQGTAYLLFTRTALVVKMAADVSGSLLKKCDETKPTCSQCTKSRRQCPGYKDEFDLVFRNETKATERRAQKANRKAVAQKMGKAGQEPISPVSSRDDEDEATLDRRGFAKSPLEYAIIPAIHIPADTQASCHFMSNFVLIPRQGSTRGFMDYLIPLMKVEPPNSHLQFAFNACALASLGNRVSANGINFRDRAYVEYTRALSATNTALRDPEASKTDAVLAAVLLLGMFEVDFIRY